MPNTTGVQSMATLHEEITEIKGKVDTLAARIYAVERISDKHDQQIITLNEKLIKIEDNTTWIKCTIMGAIITAICTGVIGGAIAIFYTVLKPTVGGCDMKKDIFTLVGGFLTALLLFFGTIGIEFEWFTTESINAFVIVVSAFAALIVNTYAVWKNTHVSMRIKQWLRKKDSQKK